MTFEVADLISKRLEEGHKRCKAGERQRALSIDDFVAVIDVKAKEWLKHEDTRKLVRPSTLFAGKNFWNYLNQDVMAAPPKKKEAARLVPTPKVI